MSNNRFIQKNNYFFSFGFSGFNPKNFLIVSCIAVFYLSSGLAFAKAIKPTLLSEQKNKDRLLIQIFLESHHIHSLPEYIQWMNQNIRYVKDKLDDRWTAPEETLSRGFGDCEDIAFLNQAVLVTLGYQPHVLGFAKEGRGHAFCIFKMNDVYAILDNTQLVITTTDSLKDIVQHIYSQERPQIFMELSLDPRKIKVFYFKTPSAG